jgi:hypothetical protein
MSQINKQTNIEARTCPELVNSSSSLATCKASVNSACRRTPILPAQHKTHKRETPTFWSTQPLPQPCQPVVRTGTHYIKSRSDTLKTKDTEQVDVDSVAVEDVDAGQDVLSSTVSVRIVDVADLWELEDWALTIRPPVAQVYFSDGAAPSQPYFHLPSCF